MVKTSLLLVLWVALAPSWSEARVVRFVVEQKRPLADGTSFGNAGRLRTSRRHRVLRSGSEGSAQRRHREPRQGAEKRARDGRVQLAVRHPQARRRREGEPQDLLRASTTGETSRRSATSTSARGGNNPLTAADVGDGFLMRLGYTIVDAGWEGDLVPGNGRLVPKFPVATTARRQPDRRAGANRVLGPDDSGQGHIHASAGGSRELQGLSGRGHEHSACDADGRATA